MAGQGSGKAFGREMVRAMSEPWDGRVITGRGTASGINQYINLESGCLPSRSGFGMIKGVAVQADSGNSGKVYIIGVNQNGNPGAGNEGYELSAGDSISLAVDDLGKVNVFIPTSGDMVRYCAIAASNNVEP